MNAVVSSGGDLFWRACLPCMWNQSAFDGCYFYFDSALHMFACNCKLSRCPKKGRKGEVVVEPRMFSSAWGFGRRK